MTETTATTQSGAHEAHDGAHEHPSDWQYVKIALILAAVTAVEVATYFESAIPIFRNNGFVIFSLLFMMIMKFWMVAGWFMHLKFDQPLFTRFFVGGIVLAVGVYVVTLAAFEFWA